MPNTQSLFDDEPADDAATNMMDSHAPLAERMRPRTLDEIVGQSHLVGADGFLRRLLAASGRLPSLILWGAPGTGKTTLARVLAKAFNLRFVQLPAVFSGVRELRAELAAAAKEATHGGRRTLLFIDEIHRFNKAQQDALLPSVETGAVTFVGATTENPSFEVTNALRSRCRVLTLKPLTEDEIITLLRRALEDAERGLANIDPHISDATLARLAKLSGGDARVALTALEIATNAAASDAATGARLITDEMIAEALGRANFAYDKGGEDHYNLASALIKSLRNSDADAGLYWLARLIEGGADPLFIARRLCILASEDIGIADPHAITHAASAAHITHLIGLPEALYPLAQTVVYLARAPKSNAVKRAYFAAAKDAQETAREAVPLHLRNAITPLMKAEGYGAGYRYVHSDAAAREEMECLPESLRGRKYWESVDDETGDHC